MNIYLYKSKCNFISFQGKTTSKNNNNDKKKNALAPWCLNYHSFSLFKVTDRGYTIIDSISGVILL